jgi:uncharacterized membrane protein YgcG
VTVPEALCTSVEEVSNRDQATNFLHRKVILLVNKLRLQQVQGDPRVITDWWFPMVTTKDSFTGATMGGDTKAPLKAFATHLDLTIDEYKKLIDLCNQPWRSLKKNHGILSETRRYQHIQWILFDEIMMESKISPTDQVSGKHPPRRGGGGGWGGGVGGGGGGGVGGGGRGDKMPPRIITEKQTI